MAPKPPAASRPSPAPSPARDPASAAPALAAAFAVVYPKPSLAIVDPDDKRTRNIHFRPVLLQRVGARTFALVSAGTDPAGAFDAPSGYHADHGYASIAYLVASPAMKLQGKPLLIAGTLGGWGAPPELRLQPGLSRQPTLELHGGYFDQGVGDDSATLFALGPTLDAVRTTADDVPLGHSQGRCNIDGKIVPVAADRTFVVRYSGSYRGRQRYVYARGAWSPDPPPPGSDGLERLCRRR